MRLQKVFGKDHLAPLSNILPLELANIAHIGPVPRSVARLCRAPEEEGWATLLSGKLLTGAMCFRTLIL